MLLESLLMWFLIGGFTAAIVGLFLLLLLATVGIDGRADAETRERVKVAMWLMVALAFLPISAIVFLVYGGWKAVQGILVLRESKS